MLNLRYVVGVVKNNGDGLKIDDLKVIRCTTNSSLEHVVERYKAVSGHDGIKYQIQVVAKVENGIVDIYDDAEYYVRTDPELRLFIIDVK